MTGKMATGAFAVIGGLSAALALLTGLPAASADELADLRANQELLQQRIDQLSQAAPGSVPIPGQYVPGYGPPTGPSGPNQPVVSGSFPRSFLVPGTDTSLRIGGFANGSVLHYFKGAAPAGQLDSQGGNVNTTFDNGQGGTGNLGSIPLNNAIGNGGRSSSTDISGKQTRFLFDARTPTAWGTARAYVEMDFAYNNTNVIQSNLEGVASGWLPRLRKGYATLGALEAGQDTGIMHDPDADPELADFGGEATAAGRAREPQVKYTYAGPYGTVFTIGIENPVPRLQGPFGQADIDTNQIPTSTACSVTGNTTANLPATTSCLGSAAFFSPLQTSWPELPGTARINQPWGHVQIGGVVRANYLNDAQGLYRKYLGAGGTISFDAHPFSGAPGPSGKDDIGGGMCAGETIGGQCANGTGVVTNYGATLFVPGVGLVNPLTSAAWNARDSNQSLPATALVNGINVRSAYNALVRTQSSSSFGGWIWYQHWWTENLRSTLEVSGIYNDMNTNILCTNVASSNATSPVGTGCNQTNNKLLSITHANLFWSPVAFIDFGVEYAWGHRVTVNNFKGDAYTLQGNMRIRF
jgi:DcaP outer membrane protein/Porin subfamily